MIEPGEAGDLRPASKSWKVKVPDTPPAIAAKKESRFHHNIREINLMNPTEEVDNHSSP